MPVIEKRENRREVACLMRCSFPMICNGDWFAVNARAEHLWIENFRGLSSYSSEEVRILIRGGWVKICGSHMEILTYTKEEIEITGCICSVCFISAGKTTSCK